jgi:hypothetical protein
MAIGLGGKIFGVRGGVRVGTKGIGYGVGAGPFKATGGGSFGRDSNSEHNTDGATVMVIIFCIAVGIIIGLGVVISFIPLIASSIILLIPFRTQQSRTTALVAATLLFGLLTLKGWNFVSNQLSRAGDPESSGGFTAFVAVLTTGWLIGFVGATFFFVYSVVRGKHFYDQIYLRPAE